MRRHCNPSQQAAEDGVVELPFHHSVGIETRYKGRAAIAGFYDVVKQLYPDLVFKPEGPHVLITTPDQVFAGYNAHTAAAATGRRIHHMFATRLVAEGARSGCSGSPSTSSRRRRRSFREGVADLPRPSDEIYSFKPGYQS